MKQPAEPAVAHRCGNDAAGFAGGFESFGQRLPACIVAFESVSGFDNDRSQNRVGLADQTGIGFAFSARSIARAQATEPRQLLPGGETAEMSDLGTQHERGHLADARQLQQTLL